MLSARQLNRATLDRQMLLRRQPADVVAAVRRVVALQAQSAASPYLALWNRIADVAPAELDAAYAERAVVKATLMRVTLHPVAADDYPDFHNAMQARLRAARLADAHLDPASRLSRSTSCLLRWPSSRPNRQLVWEPAARGKLLACG